MNPDLMTIFMIIGIGIQGTGIGADARIVSGIIADQGMTTEIIVIVAVDMIAAADMAEVMDMEETDINIKEKP
jgi:hypothetical protein